MAAFGNTRKKDRGEKVKEAHTVRIVCALVSFFFFFLGDSMVDSPASNQDHLHVAWRRPLCRFFAEGAVRSGESSSFACGDRT